MEFIQTILLLLAITGLGMFSRHQGIFSSQDKVVLNNYIYRFALPALLIHTVSGLQFDAVATAIILGSVIPILLSVGIMIILKLVGLITKEQMIIASITLGFGSNAFFGIAFFDSLYGKEAFDFAVFSAGVLGMVGIILAVGFLEYGQQGTVRLRTLTSVLKSPPVFAIFVGIALAFIGWELTFFEKASELLGKTAGGLAIFVLGMFIYDAFSLKMIKEALPYVALRVFLLPAVTWVTLMGMTSIDATLYGYLFQQSGIPAAIAIAVLAQRYAYHEKRLSAIVMLSSLMSFAVLGILYMVSMN
jgi:predicted permease